MLAKTSKIKIRRSISLWIMDRNPMKIGPYSKLKLIPKSKILKADRGRAVCALFDSKQFTSEQNSGNASQEKEEGLVIPETVVIARATNMTSVSKEKEQTELNHHTRIEKMHSSTQTSHQPNGESK